MNVYQTILKRRSIRRFKQTAISLRILKKMVNSARLAPSSANRQPCEYIIVNDQSLLDSVFATLRWAGYIAPAGDPPEGQRPVAYLVTLVNTRIRKYNYQWDVGASMENMILTALEEKIGSCWIGSINRKRLRKILGVPTYLTIDSVLALGYPNEKPVLEKMKDSIRYWKDRKGRLHVPKRKLSQILHYNKYN